jgi:hypothetical protein
MNDAGRATVEVGDEGADVGAEKRVAHFRQVVLWPVHLMPLTGRDGAVDHGALLAANDPANPWREIEDEFGDPGEFQERHYNEFVTFLPPVQRFLYGQGLGKAVRRGYGESPIRVMRRTDIAAMRVVLAPGAAPVTFRIAHVDLYFFFDIDVAMLALEICADDLPLAVVQEAMFQIGRAYPGYWETDGRGGHCPVRTEWLSPTGTVLAASDYEVRDKFLRFVCEHRAPAVAAHWEYLLRPLVLHHSDRAGPIRYRQLEYYRMPVMAYLALEDPQQLTRGDVARLALASGAGDSESLPLAERHLAAFEAEHAFDVYQEARDGQDWSATRHSVSGHAFVVTGDARNRFFMDAERGYLGRFRHQHFLLYLIAHFHRAALLMFSDRLAAAVSQFDVADAASVRTFRQETRRALETFLRFTHRYWFQEVSGQVQTRALFDLCRRHLGLDRLHAEVRQELEDMSAYLEGESLRRQNASMVRLTVVTTFGLIGTVSTGFIGMNLIDWASEPAVVKVLLFLVVFVPVIALTLYTVQKSARLSDFLDALSDEALGVREKLRALLGVWRPK